MVKAVGIHLKMTGGRYIKFNVHIIPADYKVVQGSRPSASLVLMTNYSICHMEMVNIIILGYMIKCQNYFS